MPAESRSAVRLADRLGERGGRENGPEGNQGAVSLHAQIAPSRGRSPPQPVKNLGIKAPRRDERRLYQNALQLKMMRRLLIDEDSPAVAPRWFAWVSWGYIESATRDS